MVSNRLALVVKARLAWLAVSVRVWSPVLTPTTTKPVASSLNSSAAIRLAQVAATVAPLTVSPTVTPCLTPLSVTPYSTELVGVAPPPGSTTVDTWVPSVPGAVTVAVALATVWVLSIRVNAFTPETVNTSLLTSPVRVMVRVDTLTAADTLASASIAVSKAASTDVQLLVTPFCPVSTT